jgi:hypothetical protein
MRRWLEVGRVAMFCLVAPATLTAQTDRDVAAAWGGGALGSLSGATLGLAGALAPCSLVLDATRCTRLATALGGVTGGVSGAVASYNDSGELADRLRGAGVGMVAGAALGAALRLRFRQIDWRDVGAAGLVGAAVGTAPTGAAVGLGAGLAVGAVLWLAVPGVGLPEAAALGVVGLAIGGLAEWVHAALSGRNESGVVTARFSVRL